MNSNSTRIVLLVGGLAVVAAWLSSAASTVPQKGGLSARDSAPGRSALDVSSAAAVLELEHEVSRLAARLETAPRPRVPGRNPFTLVSPQSVVPSEERVGQVGRRPVPGNVGRGEVARAVRGSRPAISLFGMAVEDTAVGQRRTAMLSVGGRVVFATIGDEVAARHQVRAVTTDMVELLDTQLGTSMRLTLR